MPVFRPHCRQDCRLTGVRRGDRLRRPPPERLAHRGHSGDHDRANEPDDERVEDDGLLVRLTLLRWWPYVSEHRPSRQNAAEVHTR